MAAPEPVMILHLRKIVQVFWIPAHSQPLKSIPEEKVCRLMLPKQKRKLIQSYKKRKKKTQHLSRCRGQSVLMEKTSKCTEKLHPNHCKSTSPGFNFQLFFWDSLSRIPLRLKIDSTQDRRSQCPHHTVWAMNIRLSYFQTEFSNEFCLQMKKFHTGPLLRLHQLH